MKKILLLQSLFLFCIYCNAQGSGSLLVSAIPTVPGFMTAHPTSPTVPSVKNPKTGFLEKMLLRKMARKFKKAGTETNKNPGTTSMILGIIALALLFIPFYTMLLAVPFGIAAIIIGNNAVKSKSHDIKKARAGIILGITALGLFLFLLILAAIIIASFTFNMSAWG